MTDDDRARVAILRDRWASYDAEYQRGEASRETVVAAYTDWADALDSAMHQPAFEARQGGALLAGIGVNTQPKEHRE